MSKTGGYMMICDFCGHEEFVPFSANSGGWHELGFVNLGENLDMHKSKILCKECSERFAIYVKNRGDSIKE